MATEDRLIADLATMGELIHARLLRRMAAGDDGAGDEITAPQRLTLRLLAQQASALTVSELAERSGVASSTMTRMVQGLVRLGYVTESAASDGDRRRRLVQITASGRQALTHATGRVHGRIVDLVAPLTPIERDELARGVRLLNGLLSQDEARRRRI